MGQAESQPQTGGAAGPTNSHGGGSSTTLAFHVLRVAENSPAAEAGIEPFFDFVVGAAGKQLGDDLDLLTDVLEDNEGREVALQIYSTKRKEVREVYVIPSRTWSSAAGPGSTPGAVDGEPSLLGLSLRLCNPHHALDQVWHVLEILEGSPAQSAGLVPYGDWIVGYAGGVLRGEGDFYDVVEAHVDKPLRLFVWNADYDVTREAILVPNRSWGGEGLLGCGVGYGLLHRIPKPQHRDRAGRAPPPSQQQSQSLYRSPPPKAPSAASTPARNDRLTSFSSTTLGAGGKLPNPLYAPPPPRAPARAPSSLSSPTKNATPPPRAPAAATVSPPPPPPARRTAALAGYDDEDDAGGGGGGSGFESSRRYYGGDDDPYGLDSSSFVGAAGARAGYGSAHEHPSFASYGREEEDDDEGGYGGRGAYDASEGVEVVAVRDGDGDGDEAGAGAAEADFVGGYARGGAGAG
ncbi:GRASP55/65 PDZ-like domain-containing protein, partial [Rhodotorula diobovata]